MTIGFPPHSVLVISLRRLGDALLTTPLIHTIKKNWPQASIDVLVFKGSEGILAHNPYIRRTITVPKQATLISHLCFLARIFRKYDLAIATQTGDQPTLYAFCAGTYRIGMREETTPLWKRWLLSESVVFDNHNTHTVLMNLKLAALLGLSDVTTDVTVRWNADDMMVVNELMDAHGEGKRFAILHPVPKHHYRKWHVQGWRDIVDWLHSQDILSVFTGGHESSETAYIMDIITPMAHKVLSVAGQLSLSQSGYLMSRAQLYIGVNTAITHMAAAIGIPTIALFGPMTPVKWGPWPKEWPLINPYAMKGSQRKNNVMLVQGEGDCVPCCEEGCDRHRNSTSECLQTLPSWRVIRAAEALWRKCDVTGQTTEPAMGITSHSTGASASGSGSTSLPHWKQPT